MRTYFSIFKLKFINSLQYRVSALAGLATQICFGLMYVLLFTAFYKMGNIPDNFSYSQMITYLWLQQAFFMYFGLFAQNKDMTKAIVEGNISYEMVRPMSLYNNWFATLYSERLAKTLLRMLPLVVIAFCLPASIRLSLPASWGAFGLFLIELVVAGFMVAGLGMLCYGLLFRTMTPNGTFAIFATVSQFCSGAMLPIPLMPVWLQNVMNYLPFRYLNDLCYRTYCGSIDLKTSAIQLGIQVAWTVAIFLLGKLVFKRNLKKVEVQGG